MAIFSSIEAELEVTQQAAEDLLQSVAIAWADAYSVMRLEKLASACARLAYSNGLDLRSNVHNLVAWCDHLDDKTWMATFEQALRAYPLASPWEAPNPTFQRTASPPLN